jgi:hypothetical protein
MPKVFLSHTASDKLFVARLAVDLRRIGVGVWYDTWEIRGGESIVEKINEGLSANDHLIVVLSPASVRSDWVKRELNSSLMRYLSERSIRLIPVLYARCDLPPLLADLRYVDFMGSYDDGFTELQVALGLLSIVPAYSSRAKRIVDAQGEEVGEITDSLFPKTFSNYPDCIMSETLKDVAIIVGSTLRERADESIRFGDTTVEVEVLGTRWRFSRQSSPGTVRDIVRVADLTAYLAAAWARGNQTSESNMEPPDTLCLVDVAVSQEILQRNIILVGAADTNIFFSLATVAYRQKFGYSLPIRYSGDDQLYFTCDQIYSDLSNNIYHRVEDSGFMHCGYLLMTANPWSPDKQMIFASGTRATGTQAALLALIRGADQVARNDVRAARWHWLQGNNRFYPSVAAKVVRATRASVINGRELIGGASEETVPPDRRISQRHLITDFEFLE